MPDGVAADVEVAEDADVQQAPGAVGLQQGGQGGEPGRPAKVGRAELPALPQRRVAVTQPVGRCRAVVRLQVQPVRVVDHSCVGVVVGTGGGGGGGSLG